MSKEIDHEYTDEVVCPYCGHEISDSWELSDHDDALECGNDIECGKLFGYERIVTVNYTSWPVEKDSA